jgi:hypothetical protein
MDHQCELSDKIESLQPEDHLCLIFKKGPAKKLPAFLNCISRWEQFIVNPNTKKLSIYQGFLNFENHGKICFNTVTVTYLI